MAYFCDSCGLRIHDPGSCKKCGGKAKAYEPPKPKAEKPDPKTGKADKAAPKPKAEEPKQAAKAAQEK